MVVIIILFYFNLSCGWLVAVAVAAVGGCDWVSCADGVGWV